MSYFDFERRPSRGLWAMAAAGALALHLGGAALAVGNLKTDNSDEGLGAAGAEIALELESPKVPDQDLPPGPEDEDQQAQQARMKQEAELKESQLPNERPIESEDPDRVVSENNLKKPKEDDPKVAAVPVEQQQESDAHVATAPQQIDDAKRESDRVKAPVAAIGKDILKLTENWNRKISAYFEQHLRYPENKKKAAVVKLDIVLDRLGKVVSVAIAESSGDGTFDKAALDMVHRSDPLPPPPAALTQDTFPFSLPVKFNANKK
jgi:periplasmic protein TonB